MEPSAALPLAPVSRRSRYSLPFLIARSPCQFPAWFCSAVAPGQIIDAPMTYASCWPVATGVLVAGGEIVTVTPLPVLLLAASALKYEVEPPASPTPRNETPHEDSPEKICWNA